MELRQLKTTQILRQAAALIEQGQKREAVRLLAPVCREDPKNLPALRLLHEAVEDESRRAQIAARIQTLEPAQGAVEQQPSAPRKQRVALDDLPGVTVEPDHTERVLRIVRRVAGVLLLLITLPLICLVGLWASLYPSREPLLQYDPAWSPDGRQIAYTAWSNSEPLSVWLMNADGSAQVNLFSGGCCAWYAQPDWSPDGTKLAFTSNASGAVGIWAAPVAAHEFRISGAPVQVWCCARDDHEARITGYPRWSPDGQAIAFTRAGVRGPNGELMADIWTIPAPDAPNAAAAPTNVTNSSRVSEQFPHWSPDGRKIVFEAYVLEGANVLPHVWDIELATGTARPFVFNDEASGNPAWSPDGQWLAFRLLEGGNYDLTLLDASRTQRVSLTDFSPAAESLPAWSPDGRHLAFVSLYEGNADIWRIHADGSVPVNLTPHTTHLPPEVVFWLSVFVLLAALALLLLFWPSGWPPLKAKKRVKAAA